MAKSETIADSSAYRYDILQRSTNFYAYRIPASIDAKRGTRECRLNFGDQDLILGREHDGCRATAATSLAKVGPESAAILKPGPVTERITSVIRNMVVVSSPLVAL